MPSDLLASLHWVNACIHQWPISQTIANRPFSELVATLRSLPRGAYHGVATGERNGATQAYLFILQSRICGARVIAGDLRGHDAVAYVVRICEGLTWTFRQATEQFAGLVPVMASLVGEGGKQLVRQIEPTMSAHLQALTDLGKTANMYILVEAADAPDTELILFSTGPGHIHRLGVGAQNVELPTVKGLDPTALMTVFRKRKASDELYQATPRFFSEELLSSLSPPAPKPAPEYHVPATAAERHRAAGALVYLLPVLIVLLLWGGWVLWGRAQAQQPGVAEPAVQGLVSSEKPVNATPVESALSPEQMKVLQEEIALLRMQISSLRAPQTSVAPTREPRPSATPDTLLARGNQSRIDSLTRRISILEGATRREEVRENIIEAGAPVKAARADTVAPPPSPRAQVAPAPVQVQKAQADTAQPPTMARVAGTEPVATPAPAQQPSRTGRPRAYAESLVDTKPEAINSPPPEYPARLRSRRVEGNVLLSVLVGVDGNVEQVVALRGYEDLRQAAVDGVRKWRFRPATLNGQTVPSWTTVAISFRAN